MSLRLATGRVWVRDPDRFDITRGTGGPEGAPFAPSWTILRPALAFRGVEGPAAAEAWERYAAAYRAEMRLSYRHRRAAWDALLARTRVVLACYCPKRERCHRGLLAEILVRLGAVDDGELSAPPARRARQAPP